MTTNSFVSGFPNEFSTGVASLDPPLVQQTKSEIRSLASEIAALAHQALSLEDFFSGFLPRMVTAMGAEAAAVWQTAASLERSGRVHTLNESSASAAVEGTPLRHLGLVAQYLLPDELLIRPSDTSIRDHAEQIAAPSLSHQRILECVISEGVPILVPPRSVSIETDRPTNPLQHSLIIVPVRVEEEIEFALEVIQQPSGGPAAQRGYLRFVAQMADLMADFLRRDALREHSRRAAHIQSFEYWLTTVAQSRNSTQQLRNVADGLTELLSCNQALLMRSGRAPKVLAVNGIDTVDPRSETVLSAQLLERQISRSSHFDASCCELKPDELPEVSTSIEELQTQLAATTLFRLRVEQEIDLIALLAYTESDAVPEKTEMQRVASALGGLLDPQVAHSAWHRTWWPFRSNLLGTQSKQKRKTWQIWSTRIALVSLLATIAFFPVRQQISATAVLSAKSKTQYFAPFDANVLEVTVDDEQSVRSGDLLLKLTSSTLEKELQTLRSEFAVLSERRRSLKQSLGNMSVGERSNALTAQLLEIDAQLKSNEVQQSVLESELAKCQIFAISSGQVTTWDVRSRLSNLPVKYGQMLLSTIDPEGEWELQVSLPEHRVGLVSDSLNASPGQGIPMKFTLASHPGVLLSGTVTDLSDQTARNVTGENVLLARAAITGDPLPLKKEGAIARVTIDCGRVPAIWLVVRDAYWACMSRLKMIW